MKYVTEVYQIIKDEQELDRFIEQLPDLGVNFKYYVSLFARKKYGGTEGLKSDKAQLKRFCSSKQLLKRKIRQLEIPIGAYEIDGNPINPESLVLYISVNPRDMHKAGVETAIELTKQALRGHSIKNPNALSLDKIQVVGQKIYFNVDIDFERNTFIGSSTLEKWLIGKVNTEAYKLIETRGGYHILINLEKLDNSYKKTWYKDIQDVEGLPMIVDLKNGDGMTPVPGCIQSTSIPRLL